MRYNSILLRLISPLATLVFFGLALTFQGMFLIVSAQSTPTSTQSTSAPAQSTPTPEPTVVKQAPSNKKFKLKIDEGVVVAVALKADKVRLPDIASEFSKQLKVPVVVGPSLQKELVSLEFTDFTLETALQLLAPCVYVDYELRSGAPPKRLGILLFGRDDPKPASNAVVQGSSQGVLIEGNTEDTGTEAKLDDDDVLQMDLDKNYLTIKSKKRPLTEVVLMIADILGVPAEIKYDSDEIVNVEFKNLRFEDAIPRLSPNIRLYIRDDVSKFERTPLKISVIQPVSKAEERQ